MLQPEARATLRDGAGAAAQTFVTRVARATGARVTLIAPDGRVVAESERDAEDVPRLENHRDRPEVRAALDGAHRPGSPDGAPQSTRRFSTSRVRWAKPGG